MAKKHIFTLLSLLSLFAYANAQEQVGEISDDSVSAEPTYPLRYNSYQPEYAERMIKLDYETILEEIDEKRAKAKKRRKTLPELDPVEAECKRCLQMLKASDQVLILDSVVVDKHDLLSAYGFGKEVGTIKMSEDCQTTEFITERGNMSYRPMVSNNDSSARLRLVSSYVENGRYIETRQLQGFDMDGDVNYPFMMSDGMTFYFASRAKDGLGNYDLYATRYDSDDNVFYRPENMGFPFNSYANDYMLVIDEALGIGWFASDRYQPEGKVCVYTFVPNESRTPVDYENTDKTLVRQKAMLCPITVTWTPENEQIRIKARQRVSLMQANNAANDNGRKEFTLVINDYYTYTRFSDFKSQKAASLCREWIKLQSKVQAMQTELDKKRTDFHNASRQQRQAMRQSLLTLEQEYERLVIEVREKEKTVRNTEIEYMK